MKTLHKILAGLLPAFLLTFSGSVANAQFATGPQIVSLLTNTAAYAVAGSATTNVPTTQARAVGVGAGGFGLGCNIAGTNSASTTNSTITLEFTVNGIDWVLSTLPLVGYALPAAGTGYAPFYTNIVTTSANMGNIKSVRIKSIQNTNLASIFITNIFIATRP